MKEIKENLDGVIKNLKNDYDYCIAITGRKRRGKSTLGYHISEYIRKPLESQVWLCYNYSELRKAMFESKQYDVIFADESISFLASGQWFKPEPQEFIELFDRMGYKNLTVILVMPAFSNFIKGFREDRLDAHIWLPYRGMAWIYAVSETKEGCSFKKKPDIKDTFQPLPPDTEEEYREIKEESMNKRIIQLKEFGFDIKKKLRKINRWLREYESAHFTQEERGEAMGMRDRTIRQWDKLDREAAGLQEIGAQD